MKKLIFFDGDGTLWYPAKTKRTQQPHWVYLDKAITDPIKEFVITPTTAETLNALGKRGIKRVLLSTSPLAEEEAIMHRIAITQHVDIHRLLDDIQVAADYPEAKGEKMAALLKKCGLEPKDALMVGDSVRRDYKPARDVGVNALLIRSAYQNEFMSMVDSRHIIDEVGDVLERI